MDRTGFQHLSWRIQRCAWGLMALIIAAAMLGVFGAGPVSRATVGDPADALRMDYQRFWRMHAPTSLHVTIAPEAVSDGFAHIWFSRAYLDTMDIWQVVPAPLAMEARPDRFVFRFKVGAGDQPVAVILTVRPTAPGTTRGELGLISGPTLHFSQFIYP